VVSEHLSLVFGDSAFKEPDSAGRYKAQQSVNLYFHGQYLLSQGVMQQASLLLVPTARSACCYFITYAFTLLSDTQLEIKFCVHGNVSLVKVIRSWPRVLSYYCDVSPGGLD
jgi:hypothetical protein